MVCTVYIYKDSKLLAPVVYLADQVYGSFGLSNLDRKIGFCPDQTKSILFSFSPFGTFLAGLDRNQAYSPGCVAQMGYLRSHCLVYIYIVMVEVKEKMEQDCFSEVL